MSVRRLCALVSVLDTHTLTVEWDGQPRQLRLMDVVPDSALSDGTQPPSELGRRALTWAKHRVFNEIREVVVELPETVQDLSNSGKLLAYVHVRDELFNVLLVREGWSPCFEKYGHPRIHRARMERAEFWARRDGRGIWGQPAIAALYERLKAHWLLRAGQVEGYRRLADLGEDILSARLDYPDILERARAGVSAVLFADVTRTFLVSDGSVLFQLGNPHQPLCALFPESMRSWASFLERGHVGAGKPNYLYFEGPLSIAADQPQITIESPDQIGSFPSRHER